MESRQKKLLGGFAALAAIVFWIGFPIYMQKHQGYSAINLAFVVTIVYWLALQGFKRYK